MSSLPEWEGAVGDGWAFSEPFRQPCDVCGRTYKLLDLLRHRQAQIQACGPCARLAEFISLDRQFDTAQARPRRARRSAAFRAIGQAFREVAARTE